MLINKIREAALSNYRVEVILDSANPFNKKRATTFKLLYPRYIHGEFMTHRAFSRNAASSRAIPITTLIDLVLSNTATPLYWGRHKAGMQAGEELSDEKIIEAHKVWLNARDSAIENVKLLDELGLHKQNSNRILEPFQNIEVLVTATEWDNFFELRCHPDAQPEINHLANLMQEALRLSVPVERDFHAPFAEDILDKDLACKKSTACNARVSYTLRDGTTDINKDIKLHDMLVVAEPMHASPAEHVLFADESNEIRSFANFQGWFTYRMKLESLKRRPQ